MSGDPGYDRVLLGILILAPVVLISLLFIVAPYGRHHTWELGPTMPVRLSWMLMESPPLVMFAYFFAQGPNCANLSPLVLAALWMAHYIHRSLIYPLQLRVARSQSMPLGLVAMGFVFNLANTFVNATWISRYGSYSRRWLVDPHFLVGVGVFVAGYVINRHSDAILRRLRQPGEGGYKVPTGGLYRWVSCPNYLGEIVVWLGWALATWSLAGLSFALFTAANLIPRALANHRWYKQTFADYPSGRRALIPLVL